MIGIVISNLTLAILTTYLFACEYYNEYNICLQGREKINWIKLNC